MASKAGWASRRAGESRLGRRRGRAAATAESVLALSFEGALLRPDASMRAQASCREQCGAGAYRATAALRGAHAAAWLRVARFLTDTQCPTVMCITPGRLLQGQARMEAHPTSMRCSSPSCRCCRAASLVAAAAPAAWSIGSNCSGRCSSGCPAQGLAAGLSGASCPVVLPPPISTSPSSSPAAGPVGGMECTYTAGS